MAHLKYTEQEFLDREVLSREKHEFYRGEIFAMAGASPAHVRIGSNILGELYIQLRGKPCQPNSSDAMVKVQATGLITYPDVSVVCPPVERERGPLEVLLNPKILFEVLSPSTGNYDRSTKFRRYQQIPSVAEIVFVSQDVPAIEHYLRQADGTWQYTLAEGLEAEVVLPSIAGKLALRQVYDRVDFPPPAPLPDPFAPPDFTNHTANEPPHPR